MPRVWVEYTVPVLALVDSESEEIVRVVEDIEGISASLTAWTDDDGCPGDELEGGADETVSAIAIANDAPWPMWEAGF